jgi:hypothetical protein
MKGETKMKGRNIFVFFMAVMILSVAISLVYAEEKVDLKLRLEKGKSYKIQTNQDMKINQTIPGQQGQQQTMTINQKTGGRNIYTVEDVQSDGTFVLKITHDAISFKQEVPTQNQIIEYDSTDTSTAVGAMSVFNAIVGQSFTITMTPDGHIKEIKGADILLERIQEKVNELPEGQERAGLETQLKMQYGAETLKQNTENSFNMYPDKPVGIGDTWQRKTTLTQGFPMVIDTIYTLKERKNGIAIIDVFAMIQTNRDAGPMEMGQMKIQYNMSGSVTGLMEMQESTGWPIRSNQNLRLSGSITVQNPEMPQPMSIPMSISGTITQEPY